MYLGIDLGTSELKIVLIDADQCLVATARSELGAPRPPVGAESGRKYDGRHSLTFRARAIL